MAEQAQSPQKLPAQAQSTQKLPPVTTYQSCCVDVHAIAEEFKGRPILVNRKALFDLLVEKGPSPTYIASRYVKDFFRKQRIGTGQGVLLSNFCDEYVRMQVFALVKDLAATEELTIKDLLGRLANKIGPIAALKEIQRFFVAPHGEHRQCEFITWVVDRNELHEWYANKKEQVETNLYRGANNHKKLGSSESEEDLRRRALLPRHSRLAQLPPASPTWTQEDRLLGATLDATVRLKTADGKTIENEVPRGKDCPARFSFPASTFIVSDYSDGKNKMAKDEEDRKNKLKKMARHLVGDLKSLSVFKSLHHTVVMGPEKGKKQHSAIGRDGLHRYSHNFKDGPLRISALKYKMFPNEDLKGVRFIGLQPFVRNVKPTQGEAQIQPITSPTGEKARDARNDPMFTKYVQFQPNMMVDFIDGESRELLKPGISYKLILDDSERQLCKSVNEEKRKELKDLFDRLDQAEPKRHRIHYDEIYQHYGKLARAQEQTLRDYYGSDESLIQKKLQVNVRRIETIKELFMMREAEEPGLLRFFDFLAVHAKAEALLKLQSSKGAKKTRVPLAEQTQATTPLHMPTATFPFSSLTALATERDRRTSSS